MTITTKVYYQNPFEMTTQGLTLDKDSGYRIPIPANPVSTFGWQYGVPTHGDAKYGETSRVWGQENVMTTRADPEWYAPNNEIRSNVIPEIDPKNPIYQFDRAKFTHRVF